MRSQLTWQTRGFSEFSTDSCNDLAMATASVRAALILGRFWKGASRGISAKGSMQGRSHLPASLNSIACLHLHSSITC